MQLEAIAESEVTSDKLIDLMNTVYAEVDEGLKVRAISVRKRSANFN